LQVSSVLIRTRFIGWGWIKVNPSLGEDEYPIDYQKTSHSMSRALSYISYYFCFWMLLIGLGLCFRLCWMQFGFYYITSFTYNVSREKTEFYYFESNIGEDA
jgi:hypothetical protein